MTHNLLVAGSNPAGSTSVFSLIIPSRTTAYKTKPYPSPSDFTFSFLALFPVFFRACEERKVTHSSPAFSIYSTLEKYQEDKSKRRKIASLETCDSSQNALFNPFRTAPESNGSGEHLRLLRKNAEKIRKPFQPHTDKRKILEFSAALMCARVGGSNSTRFHDASDTCF